jgi:hypothetical protein
MSTYAPGWVKSDSKRLPRARILNPEGNLQVCDALTLFSSELVKSDVRVFARLKAHLKDVDAGHTVVVQLENEVGLLGDSRERLVNLSSGLGPDSISDSQRSARRQCGI